MVPPPSPHLRRFNNTLTGPARGKLEVTLVGQVDPRAGDNVAETTVVEHAVLSSAVPDTKGVYTAAWTPRLAGDYSFSATYLDQGGLLAS